MKTFFSAVTGHPGARSHFLGRLACIAFVSGSTISLSFAGLPDGGARGSGGSFVGPVQRIGFTASHGNVDAHNLYPRGYRSGRGYAEDRGSLDADLFGSEEVSIFNTGRFIPSSARSSNDVRSRKGLCANSLDLLELNVAASRAQPRNR